MGFRSSSLVVALCLAGGPACTSTEEPLPQADGGAAGSAVAGSAGLVATGGSGSGVGGSPSTGGTSGAGGTNTGAAGTSSVGGSIGGGAGGAAGAPVAGNTGAGGAGAGGSSAGTGPFGGSGGTAGRAAAAGAGGGGTGGAMTFTCNQVTAMTLTREWFDAGFQQDGGIIDSRWQLKAREHGYVTEWSNPSSDFWNEPIESPCTSGSTSPDHVVLTVLSWAPACCDTQPEWEAQVRSAVATLQAKYAALKRIDLMTVIRGPDNMLCPTPPAAGETIVMPPELDTALAAVAAANPGLVFVAPKFEAASCSAFSGGGPHLTTAGNTAVARNIAAYFAALQ